VRMIKDWDVGEGRNDNWGGEERKTAVREERGALVDKGGSRARESHTGRTRKGNEFLPLKREKREQSGEKSEKSKWEGIRRVGFKFE